MSDILAVRNGEFKFYNMFCRDLTSWQQIQSKWWDLISGPKIAIPTL